MDIVFDSKAILFDWDGTLLDSFPAGYRASITVLRHLGFEVDRKRFLETYSPNWYESYRLLGVPEEEWSNADALWRRTYREHESPLFPFVEKLLTRFDAAGYTLGLVTSGTRDRVDEELKRFRLDGLFAVTVCFEDTTDKKPHPAPLALAIEALDAEARSCIYVGDRPEDIEMGRRVGTYTVGVESEYGPRDLLERAEPDLLLVHAGLLADRFGV
ncbi:MAG TPA: HAD family hydrolase [Vicinamibacteria bacterium]|nr:HAD family hydrolase [Vicinamibacteria bacterium]